MDCKPVSDAEDGSLHWLQRCDGMSNRYHVWRWMDHGDGEDGEEWHWEYHGTLDHFYPDSEYMRTTWRYIGPAFPPATQPGSGLTQEDR